MATIALAREMSQAGRRGSIVTLLCDSGTRYGSTYFNADWLAQHGGAWQDVQSAVLAYLKDGRWSKELFVDVREPGSQVVPLSV